MKSKRKRSEQELKAAEKAIDAMGGISKAARLMTYATGNEVSAPSVYSWLRTGIPPSRADDVYNCCGAKPWETNPGTFPKRLANLGYQPLPYVLRRAKAFAKKGFPTKGQRT